MPRIRQNENYYSISIYDDDFNPKNAAIEVVRLQVAFPGLPVGFFDILLDRIKENGFTDKRFKDAVDHLIDNFNYPVPSIANIISFDKRIKLYSYNDIIEMVGTNGISIWDEYKAIRKIGNIRFFASIKDIETYHLNLLK